MIVANLYIPNGCILTKGEYNLEFVAAINDVMDLVIDAPKLVEAMNARAERDARLMSNVLYEVQFLRKTGGFLVYKVMEIETMPGAIPVPKFV